MSSRRCEIRPETLPSNNEEIYNLHIIYFSKYCFYRNLYTSLCSFVGYPHLILGFHVLRMFMSIFPVVHFRYRALLVKKIVMSFVLVPISFIYRSRNSDYNFSHQWRCVFLYIFLLKNGPKLTSVRWSICLFFTVNMYSIKTLGA